MIPGPGGRRFSCAAGRVRPVARGGGHPRCAGDEPGPEEPGRLARRGGIPGRGAAGVCPGAVDDLNGVCEAVEGSGVSELRKGCWQIRKMFIPMIMTPRLQAKMVVTRGLTWAPVTSRRQVSSTSGTRANGMPKDSTTWLRTSASVGSSRPQFRSQLLPALVRLPHSRQDTRQPRRQHSPLRARRPRPSRNTAISLQPRNHASPSACRGPADTTSIQNSTHKTSGYLPGQSSSTPADAFSTRPTG